MVTLRPEVPEKDVTICSLWYRHAVWDDTSGGDSGAVTNVSQCIFRT